MGPSLPGSASSSIGLTITSEFDGAGLDDAEAQLDSASESFQTLGDAADEAAAQVTTASDEVNASFVSLGVSADEYAANLAIVQEAAEGATGEITIMGTAADEAAISIDAASGASEAGAAGGGGLFAALSNPWVLAGAAIAGATALMVKSAAEFQTGMTKLYTTAGETANYNDLSNAILGVAQATGTATTDLLNAQYYISSAGYTALDGVNILKAAAEGAKEEGASTVDVANALTTVMHDYGANSNQATEYMNQLLAAVSVGKTTLEDYSKSLSTVMEVAKNSNLSFAQVAGALSTITEAGVTSNEATDQLRSLILGIITPTATAAKTMENFGLNVTELAQNLGSEGLTGTLEEVIDAVAKFTGPSGLVLQQTLQNATVAQQKLNQEMGAMPPQLKSLTEQLQNGQISFAAYRTAVQALPEGMTNLGKQFEATYNQANSFNNLLTNGSSPAVQTLTATLKTLFPNINATQAVLELTGANAATAAANTQKVADASKNAGNAVAGWSAYQGTLSGQLGMLKETIGTTADKIGTGLIPYLTAAARAFNDILTPVLKYETDSTKLASDVLALANGPFNLLVSVLGAVGRAFDESRSKLDSFGKDLSKLGGYNFSLIGNVAKDLHIPGFASGITNFGGGLALVGETGPELVYLPQGSSVMPSTETGSMMSSTTTSQNTTNNSHQVTIGQVNLSTAAAVSAFITQLDLDNIAVGKGLTASRGVS